MSKSSNGAGIGLRVCLPVAVRRIDVYPFHPVNKLTLFDHGTRQFHTAIKANHDIVGTDTVLQYGGEGAGFHTCVDEQIGSRKAFRAATLFGAWQGRHIDTAFINVLEANADSAITFYNRFNAASSVRHVVRTDKLLAEFANAVNVRQHSSRVERHGGAGVVRIGAGGLSDSHDLLASDAKVLKAGFNVHQRGDYHGVE